MLMFRLISLIMILCVGLEAAEVLRVGRSQKVIAISQDRVRPFRKGDRICVISEERVCGVILKAARRGAIVRLEKAGTFVSRGDLVELQGGKTRPSRRATRRSVPRPPEAVAAPPSRAVRRPSAKLLDSTQMSDGAKNPPSFNLSGGISAGFTYFYPMVHMQFGLSSYLSVGMMPLYYKASVEDSSVQAFGGMITLNYHGNEYFRGFWAQLAAGFQSFTATTLSSEESGSGLSVLATAGWRGYWDLGLNVGVGAGFQFVKDPEFANAEIGITGFRPVVVLDVGVNF